MASSEMLHATPQAAEAAFYQAFEQQDIDAMRGIWADSDAAICIHPMGERLCGAAAILDSWQRIFAGDGAMRFSLGEPIYITDENTSVHYVYENIRFGADFGDSSQVLATNVYIRTDAGWRIQAHHGSPVMAQPTRSAPPPSPADRLH